MTAGLLPPSLTVSEDGKDKHRSREHKPRHSRDEDIPAERKDKDKAKEPQNIKPRVSFDPAPKARLAASRSAPTVSGQGLPSAPPPPPPAARARVPITFRVKYPPVILPPEELFFSWGSYDSEYSDSFSGYDNPELALGEEDSGDLPFHLPEPPRAKWNERPKRPVFSGQIVGASGLPEVDGQPAVTHVTVELLSRGDRFSSDVAEGTSAPNYDFDFDFGSVNKKKTVEVTVWANRTTGKDIRIGCWRQKVSELELGNTEKQALRLTAPLKVPDALKEVADFGTVYAILNYQHS
jgi:hypothetical protein